MSSQLRAAGKGEGSSTTYDALVARDAWVNLADAQERGRAFIHDALQQRVLHLRGDEDLAILARDACLLALSGILTPNVRPGQLESVVKIPNPRNIACINVYVRKDPALTDG